MRLAMLGAAALKATPLAPPFVVGCPSVVDVLTGNCALPEAFLATLTVMLNVGIALTSPETEAELVQVMV